MSLLDEIRSAQIRAGEDAVIRNLESIGLAQASPTDGEKWKAEAERIRLQFQQETLRTSGLSEILREWISRHENAHEPGAWSRNCQVCNLVRRSRELLGLPINMGPNV